MSEAHRRQGPFAALASACTKRPGLTVGLAAIIFALSLLALQRLKISGSLEAMLGLDSPAAKALHRVTTQYQSGEALFIIADTGGKGVPAPAEQAELVAFAQRLTESLVTDPRTHDRVAWARFRQDPAYISFAREIIFPRAPFYLGPGATREFIERLSPERLREQFARNEAMIAAPGPAGGAIGSAILRDPLRLAELMPRSGGAAIALDAEPAALPPPEYSHDGAALLIRVAATGSINDLEGAAALTSLVGQLAAAANTGSLQVRVGGPYAISAASSRTIRSDAITSTLVSVALIYILFIVFQRRWLSPILIGITACAGLLAGFGTHALAAPTVSPLAAAVAALLAGLGVDYGIHFVSHYDALRATGVPPRESANQTARHMALPIVTNCFTSIFGFASLWPSRIPMLSDFARLGAAGLVGSLLATFTLLPALLVLTDRRSAASDAAPPRFGFVADAVARRPRRWMVSSLVILLVVIVGAGVQGFVPRIESDLRVLHPQPNPALAATDEVIARFSGQGEMIPVLLRVSSPDELVPAAIDTALSLTSDACRAAGVADVIGVHLLLPDPRRAQGVRGVLARVDPEGALAEFDRALEDSAFDASAYEGYRTFLGQLLASDAPPGIPDLLKYPSIAARMFPMDRGAGPPAETLLVVRLASPLRDRAERSRVVQTLSDALRKHPGATLAGLAAVSADLEDTTKQGLLQSVFISTGLVLLWLIIVFRRPLDVLLAITPLLFAALFAVAFIIATKQRFNPINSIAIPLMDGIAVDAGVFLVSVARRTGRNSQALSRELRPTVHAVLLATTTTITGFAALGTMHTPATRSLGLIAAVGIGASAIGAVCLLVPILLARARAKG